MRKLRDSDNRPLNKAVGLILPDGINHAPMKVANLVIFRSADGVNWEPVLPENVPGWVKDPANIGQLVAGFSASRTSDPFHWRAERIQ